MSPYLPFALIPIAALAAWYMAPDNPVAEPGRFTVPKVAKFENPYPRGYEPGSIREEAGDQPPILVKVFLPHIPPPAPEREPLMVLHGLSTGKNANVATINGRTVKEGDVILGYRVKRIAAKGVDLARKGRIRHLPMRALHELPPPVNPGAIAQQGQKRAAANLNEDFWRIFDSLNP